MSALPPIPVTSASPELVLRHHAAYIITFRLSGTQAAYEDFFNELKDLDGWFNYTPNLWIVLTKRPLVYVAASLRAKIRTTDWLLVMPAKGPVDGWLPDEAWNWLNTNLQKEWS